MEAGQIVSNILKYFAKYHLNKACAWTPGTHALAGARTRSRGRNSWDKTFLFFSLTAMANCGLIWRMKQNLSVADVITAKIIEQIEKGGLLPWQKPWTSVSPRNAVSGRPYSGINRLIAEFFGNDSLFLTKNQINDLGGSINVGAKSLPIVWNIFREETDAMGRKVSKWVGRRYYSVFALSDTTCKIDRPEAKKLEFSPIDAAEKILSAVDCPIAYGGGRAFYVPSEHRISLPLRESFASVGHFYCTAFHESTHATAKTAGHKLDSASFGSEPYAKEELVAELGAAFLLSACGISSQNLFDHSASYLSGWLDRLKRDTSLILTASSQAQFRANILLEKAGMLAEKVSVD